jgi:hypothetical protein
VCLLTLKRGGYATKPSVQGGRWRATEKRLLEDAGPKVNVAELAELAERADRLICAQPAGLTSLELALELGVGVDLIEAALAPAVEKHHFITCTVVKAGLIGTAYRLSSSGTMRFDWRTQSETVWKNTKAAMLARPSKPARPDVTPAVSALETPSPQPDPDSTTDSTTGSVSVWSFTGGTPLRELPVIEMPSEGPDLGAMESDFLCAIYSNGSFFIEAHGARITLKLQHTRRLLHYIEHMRASDLVAVAEEARS